MPQEQDDPPQPLEAFAGPMQAALDALDGDAPEPPPSPPPTLSKLESLPDIAHNLISTYLPDGDEYCNRLSLSMVSKTMLELYGGTLTEIVLEWEPGHSAEALAGVVERQHALQKLSSHDPEVIPALVPLFSLDGCLNHLRELKVCVDVEQCVVLADALPLAGGALQGLEQLAIYSASEWEKGMLPRLADALASEIAPLIWVLDFGPGGRVEDEDLEALAAMLETRAQLPACRGLEQVQLFEDWMDNFDELFSDAARCRLMRAMLLTVTELDEFGWAPEYEACFVEAPPPRLKTFQVSVGGDATPSVAVWEAMPEIVEVSVSGMEEETDNLPDEMAGLGPLVAALNGGVTLTELRSLEVDMSHLRDFGLDFGLDPLLRALAGAPCASQLTTLELGFYWAPATMATFADFIGKDKFPMLDKLSLTESSNLCMNTLCKGLLAASHTPLTWLELTDVDMDDSGMAALASVVRGGGFPHLHTLDISHNEEVTDKGLSTLAQAVEETGERGLPTLYEMRAQHLQSVVHCGFRVLASALINHCPLLVSLDFVGADVDVEELGEDLAEMLQEAGCSHRVDVRVVDSDDEGGSCSDEEEEEEEEEEEDFDYGEDSEVEEEDGWDSEEEYDETSTDEEE